MHLPALEEPGKAAAPAGRLKPEQVLSAVQEALRLQLFIDVHTHLFAPWLGSLGLWGIDELLTYHYLEAELFRCAGVAPDEYFAMPKRQRADLIWRALFVERAPVSEATRGVVAVLSAFGLDTGSAGLSEAREYFQSRTLDAHIQRVFQLAGVDRVAMTNDPLDPQEAPLWRQGAASDPRFLPVLRLDRLLNSGQPVDGARRFLAEWIGRMRPLYLAVSLPDSFRYPEESAPGRLLRQAVLPACGEFDLPLSLMIGVRYQVNPALRLAGDACGRADLTCLERLCGGFPEVRFLVSVLSRENQHELCVYARKFANLMPFGCWWFLNNPSIVEEMTRERMEMLGTSFIPQHSDARVLEQLIYKWRNTRRTLAPVLADAYRRLGEDGGAVTKAAIQAGVRRLFRTNFAAWVKLPGEES
jgi:hypothetical protein